MARADQPLTAHTFNDLVLDVQDSVRLEKTEQALSQAHRGALRLLATVKLKGRPFTEAIIAEGGASPELAQAIVDQATRLDGSLPLVLLAALMEGLRSDRQRLAADAMTSHAMARWVDGADPKEAATALSSTVLLAKAESAKAYPCFLYAMILARRVIRNDRALRAALYICSNDVEQDRQAYTAGQAAEDVGQVFGLVATVLGGSADEDGLDRFSQALTSRVELANGVAAGAARDPLGERVPRSFGPDPRDVERVRGRSPDAMVWSTTRDGRPHLIIGYASIWDNAKARTDVGFCLEHHWRGLPMTDDADLLVITSGPSPVADAGRTHSDRAWADDVAVVRTAATVFGPEDPTVLPAILRGQAAFAGWFFAAKPVVLDVGIAATIQRSLNALMADGYPSDNRRGIEILVQTLSVLHAWAIKHPESFPYFQDQKVVDWLDRCPVTKEGVATASTGASLIVDRPRAKVVEMAERSRAKREAELARDRASSAA
ncbi:MULTISPECIES: hypothetical protein [Burkholderia]|uniref:hypothetical protein n=1 Tax=Burkholderia TaxID=32008 RepID=UPI0019061F8E|nr:MULTISPECIES: hypothetical protein [Burkholderia]MBJ9920654.1 hypothetical protein [Burkholderia cenocepacia]